MNRYLFFCVVLMLIQFLFGKKYVSWMSCAKFCYNYFLQVGCRRRQRLRSQTMPKIKAATTMHQVSWTCMLSCKNQTETCYQLKLSIYCNAICCIMKCNFLRIFGLLPTWHSNFLCIPSLLYFLELAREEALRICSSWREVNSQTNWRYPWYIWWFGQD